jgi:hypothetical protein
VYIEQPQGFEVEYKKTHVCGLKKAQYGLKQDHRAWYGRIDSFLTSLGFTKSKVDSNIYFKEMKGLNLMHYFLGLEVLAWNLATLFGV